MYFPRSPLSLIILLFLLACNTTERVVHFSPDNTQAMLVSTNDVANLQAQYGNFDGVFLTYNRTLEHNVSIAFTSTIPHWKFYEIIDRSFVLFNVDSPELNAFRLEVPANSRLEQAAITVQAPGSTGIVYRKDDLIEEFDGQGNTIYSLSYSGIQPGSVVSEKYEITRGDLERNPPVAHDVPLQMNLPVRNMNFQYVYPIWWQVQVKDLSLNQPLNYERIEDGERRKIMLTYNSQDVPAYVESPAAPYFKQAAPYFQVQVTNLSMGSAVRVRAPEDWTEFAREYREYATSIDARPSRSLERTTDQIVGHVVNDVDRVEAILNYIADNVFLDASSRQRNLDMVLSRREGNAYMIAGLMQAMLAAANIDSEYLLVHPASEGYFDPEFVAEAQVREPALGVFVDGSQYYVFPGMQRSLSEPIPALYAGQPALVITPDGFGGFTEIFSDQPTAAPPLIVDRGATPVQSEPVSQPPAQTTPVQSDPISQPPAQTTPVQVVEASPVNTDPISQPPATTTPNSGASTTGGSIIGSPIGTPVQNPQPEVVDSAPPPPPVREVTEDIVRDEPNALPEWLGSIKRNLGGWTWIVASRTSMEEAETVANEYIDLFRDGLSVDVLAGESNGVIRYRIAIGQYPNRNQANQDRSRLGNWIPGDAWILEIQPNM